MFSRRIFIIVHLVMSISFLHAATVSRLCERMTYCDLIRLIRTHNKQITTVNEKTKRVDFLINELQTGGTDLSQRIDILESLYQNVSEHVSSFYRPYTTDDTFVFSLDRMGKTTIQLSDIMNDIDESPVEIEISQYKPDEENSDYEQSIAELNEAHKQLHDTFVDVENEFEDLKEKISLSVNGAVLQAYDLQRMREDLNRGEDVLRTLGTVVHHHFEELELIRGFRDPGYNTIVSVDLELNELDEKYTDLETEINELASTLNEKGPSRNTNSQETNDNMRYTRDELKTLKMSMDTLNNAVKDTQHKCIDGSLELASKMRDLYRRIKNIGRKDGNCKG